FEFSVRRRLPWTMVVESCGSVACRALLLKTPRVLVTPTKVPPVTLLCCVYLKSARLVPAARIVTASTVTMDLTRMLNLLINLSSQYVMDAHFLPSAPNEVPAGLSGPPVRPRRCGHRLPAPP